MLLYWPKHFLTCSFTDVHAISQVCLVRGEAINLGELSGVIGFFLLVRHAVKTSVEAAFKFSDPPGGRLLHERLKIPAERPPAVLITPGPLVDWRARTLLTVAQKRKRDEKAANAVSKRQRSSRAVAANDDWDDEEEGEEESPVKSRAQAQVNKDEGGDNNDDTA